MNTMEALVRERARALGFDAVGIARASVALDVEHERYRRFIERGMHGSMSYLAEHAEVRRRVDEKAILEGAKSIICLARRYGRPADEERNDSALVRSIARYARGQDYHGFLKKRLVRLAQFVRTLAPGVEARAICDIEPVMERAWAARAGLGFVGKNGLVIIPGQGSYVLLGEVVTTLELLADTPMTERCGSCTRCLDACPTQAFEAPFVLDPRRCISYLTIEHRGAPPPELREGIGEHLFGCDVCQEVCPYNRTSAPPLDDTVPFHPHERFRRLGLDDLVALEPSRWDDISRGSPLRRARREGLARNAAIVAENRLRRDPNDAEARRALDRAAHSDHPLECGLISGKKTSDNGQDGHEEGEEQSDRSGEGPEQQGGTEGTEGGRGAKRRGLL